MRPETEHEHHPKPRRRKALCLRGQSDEPCDAGREEGKGWVSVDKDGETA